MDSTHLADVAAQLRKQGFEARNLGQVGITVWHGGKGHFFPLEKSRDLTAKLAAGGNVLRELLEARDGRG
jgi:hypothetical protein